VVTAGHRNSLCLRATSALRLGAALGSIVTVFPCLQSCGTRSAISVRKVANRVYLLVWDAASASRFGAISSRIWTILLLSSTERRYSKKRPRAETAAQP
jgi:hypothetical protein